MAINLGLTLRLILGFQKSNDVEFLKSPARLPVTRINLTLTETCCILLSNQFNIQNLVCLERPWIPVKIS